MSNPEALKKMEKTIVGEGKTEENLVKHAIKDLVSTGKSQSKAQKAADKAEHTLEKTDKKEYATAKALDKATHKHNIAVTNLKSAEKDVKLKQQHDAKLHHELQTKKAQVDGIVKQKEDHDKEREAKLAAIQSKLEAVPPRNT